MKPQDGASWSNLVFVRFNANGTSKTTIIKFITNFHSGLKTVLSLNSDARLKISQSNINFIRKLAESLPHYRRPNLVICDGGLWKRLLFQPHTTLEVIYVARERIEYENGNHT